MGNFRNAEKTECLPPALQVAITGDYFQINCNNFKTNIFQF